MTALLTADEAARLRVGVNVIVRPGDRITVGPSPTVNHGHAYSDFVAPQDWVALTGPCPTCDGTRIEVVPAAAHGGNVDMRNECPDCRDGRRIVPVRWLCPQLDVHMAGDVDGWDECFYGCGDDNYLTAEGSIEVVPVVAAYEDVTGPCIRVFPALGGCVAHHLPQLADGEWSLDPLPVPGKDWGVVIDVVES